MIGAVREGAGSSGQNREEVSVKTCRYVRGHWNEISMGGWFLLNKSRNLRLWMALQKLEESQG